MHRGRGRSKYVPGAKSLVEVEVGARPEEEPRAAESAVSGLPCSRRWDRGDRAPSFPGWTYCAAQRQPWCNAAPCRRPGKQAWLQPAGSNRREATTWSLDLSLESSGQLGCWSEARQFLVSMKITIIANIYYDPGTVLIL